MFDWFWEFLYSIQYAILYLIDFVVDVFRILAGLNTLSIPTEYDDATGEAIAWEDSDLLTYLISNYSTVRAFLLVVCIAFALLIIFTIIAVIRKQYLEEREQRSIGAIVGSAMKSSLMFILLPVIMIAASTLLVVLAQQLDLATSPYYEELYESGANTSTGYSGLSVGGILLCVIGSDCTKSGYNATDFITGAAYYDLETAKTYFTIKNLNYFLGYVAGIIILVLFIKSLFTFVERIFAILGLFIVSPVVVSSSVLDGGARFKSWREEVLNKFVIAYSVLLAINLYFLVIPIVMDIDFNMDSALQEYLIKLFFVIGGAFAVNRSTTWFGNLVNSGAGSQAQMESDAAGRSLLGAGTAAVRGATRLAGGVLRGAGQAWNGIKTHGGFVTPMDRWRHRGEAMREAKLKTRDESKAKRWQDNFYAEHPDEKPSDYKPNYASSMAGIRVTDTGSTGGDGGKKEENGSNPLNQYTNPQQQPGQQPETPSQKPAQKPTR